MKTIEELKKVIDRRKWTVASTPAHLMTCHPWVAGFVRMRRVYRHSCTDMWLIIKDAIGCQAFDERENYENVKQLYDDPERTREIHAAWQEERAAFLAKSQQRSRGLDSLDNATLGRDFSEFLEACTKTWESSAAIDNMGIYTEGHLLKEFTDAIPASEKPHAHEFFAAISQPSDCSYIMREHSSLLSIALTMKQNGEAAAEEALAAHQREFFWTANSYKDIKVLSLEHFRALAREEAKMSVSELASALADLEALPVRIEGERERLLDKFRLSASLEKKMRLTPVIGAWLDERKEVTVRGNHYLTLYLREIGKHCGYSLEQMYYFTPPEIARLLSDGARVPKEELASRRHRMVYVVSQLADSAGSPQEEVTLLSGNDADDLTGYFEQATGTTSAAKTVKGVVASRGQGGKIKGKVQVILDPEGATFEQGNVLVSTMTRAEYVPFMKKAAAIITDEGGITCHAAVVSSELRKPCIIGTKHASKAFKD